MRLTIEARGRRLLDLDLAAGWLTLDVFPPARPAGPPPDLPPERDPSGSPFLAGSELAGPPPPPILFGFARPNPEEGVPWRG